MTSVSKLPAEALHSVLVSVQKAGYGMPYTEHRQLHAFMLFAMETIRVSANMMSPEMHATRHRYSL
jgi:hypothetical protein